MYDQRLMTAVVCLVYVFLPCYYQYSYIQKCNTLSSHLDRITIDCM